MSTPLRERPDAPLGTLIFRAGLLPAETIENALEEGVKTGRRLGEILIERGLLEEEDLTRLLAGQKGLPFVSLRNEQIDPEATKLLSEDQARLFSALPIRFENGFPLVAVADPTNDVLNRNIREALGQDIRFIVAGRTELNEVIGEAYSGTLQAFSPQPEADEAEAEAEALPELPPLRVDTSVPPAAEPLLTVHEPDPAPEDEPEPVAAAEPVTAADPEAFAAPEPEPFAAPEPEPIAAPEPEPIADPEPEPVFQAPAFEPEPAPEPEASPAPEPEPVFEAPELEPEPAPEPVAAFEAPAAPEFEPAPEAAPAPEPLAPAATEPVVEESPPETNGRLPQDLEDDLRPTERVQAAAEAAAPARVETVPAEAEQAPEAGGNVTVSIRLTSGERLVVAECSDLGEAKGYAKALTKQLGVSEPDDWPFVNGRFLKPDTIVSVDVEES